MFWNVFGELCNERNVKPTPLLRQLGIAAGLSTKWKNGSLPDVRSLNLLSEYFNVSIDYLLGKTDQKEKPLVNGDEELNEYLEELKNRSEMRMLFSLAKGATKENVEVAVKIIEALRSQGDGDE